MLKLEIYHLEPQVWLINERKIVLPSDVEDTEREAIRVFLKVSRIDAYHLKERLWFIGGEKISIADEDPDTLEQALSTRLSKVVAESIPIGPATFKISERQWVVDGHHVALAHSMPDTEEQARAILAEAQEGGDLILRAAA